MVPGYMEGLMAATKADAIRVLVRAAMSNRPSQAEVNRIIRACKTLGLDRAETITTLTLYDYCDATGRPWNADKITIPLAKAGA